MKRSASQARAGRTDVKGKEPPGDDLEVPSRLAREKVSGKWLTSGHRRRIVRHMTQTNTAEVVASIIASAKDEDLFAIAPCGGEFKVTNRQTGEHIGYFLSRAAADNAAVLAMRALTDKAAQS